MSAGLVLCLCAPLVSSLALLMREPWAAFFMGSACGLWIGGLVMQLAAQ